MNQPIKMSNAEVVRALLWFTVAALALSLPLMMNLAGRVRAEAEMRAAVGQMSAQMKTNTTKLAQLQTALDYAKSSAYVERWARAQAHWAKPGETVVTIPAAITQTTQPETPPRLWWEAFLTQ